MKRAARAALSVSNRLASLLGEIPAEGGAGSRRIPQRHERSAPVSRMERQPTDRRLAVGDPYAWVKMNPPTPIAPVAPSQGFFPVDRRFGRSPSTACIHMQLRERLRNALKIGARDFSHALDCFDPCPGRDNSYPERMVSYYYIQALARALPGYLSRHRWLASRGSRCLEKKKKKKLLIPFREIAA